MKAQTTAIGFAAALALALPAAAAGAGQTGSVVPPENSAATQYTEAIPTAGGDKQAGEGGRKASPKKILGAKNAHKLESHGKEGQEVAEVVAETAPETSVPAEVAPAPEPRPQHASTGGGDGKAQGGGNGKAHHAKPDGQANRPHRDREPTPVEPAPAATPTPDGSSALGEVLAAMTGSSSSGELGALLPLAILAAIAWGLAYFWRQRRPAS